MSKSELILTILKRVIISCDIKDGNENLAERSTLALNNDIIKKQFEGIIAKLA